MKRNLGQVATFFASVNISVAEASWADKRTNYLTDAICRFVWPKPVPFAKQNGTMGTHRQRQQKLAKPFDKFLQGEVAHHYDPSHPRLTRNGEH